MEVSNLTETKAHADLFRRSILEDIPYWQAYLKEKAEDALALRRKREHIHRNIQFALDLEEGWQPLQTLIETFSAYAERWGYWSEWQTTLKHALKVAHHYKDQTGEVKLSTLMARLSQRQSRSQDAIGYYRQAIQAARKINDFENRARAYSNLGFLYAELGYWWRAEVLCCHALAIFKAFDHHHGLAHTENHLGYLYNRQERWDEAEQHLKQACTIWEKTGDKHGLMRGYINLGILYIDTQRVEKALSSFKHALDYAHSTGDELSLATTYVNIGYVYNLKKDYDKAEVHIQKANSIFQQHTYPYGLALVQDNLGLIYLQLGKWRTAEHHLSTALELWRKLGSKYNEIQSMTYLVEYELARRNKNQASKWLNKAEALLFQYDGMQRDLSNWARVKKLRRSLSELHGETAA